MHVPWRVSLPFPLDVSLAEPPPRGSRLREFLSNETEREREEKERKKKEEKNAIIGIEPFSRR